MAGEPNVKDSSHGTRVFLALGILVAAADNPEARERLKVLEETTDGFRIAEADLQQRGPGELSGRKQWGISDVGMEALKNLKLVEAAREEAQEVVKKDETLARHPLLRAALAARPQAHFE